MNDICLGFLRILDEQYRVIILVFLQTKSGCLCVFFVCVHTCIQLVFLLLEVRVLHKRPFVSHHDSMTSWVLSGATLAFVQLQTHLKGCLDPFIVLVIRSLQTI